MCQCGSLFLPPSLSACEMYTNIIIRFALERKSCSKFFFKILKIMCATLFEFVFVASLFQLCLRLCVRVSVLSLFTILIVSTRRGCTDRCITMLPLCAIDIRQQRTHSVHPYVVQQSMKIK